MSPIELEREAKKLAPKIKIAIPKDLHPVNGLQEDGNLAGKGWQLQRKFKKVQPNDKCTCGSGKKAKKCCYSPYH